MPVARPKAATDDIDSDWLDEMVSRWLAPRFGEGLRLSYDADAVEALGEARETLWSKLNGAAFLTVNEKRVAAGYSPLEGGDTL